MTEHNRLPGCSPFEISDQAAQWYVACRSNALTEAERKSFVQWLRHSPAHAAEYLSISQLALRLAHGARQSPEPLHAVLQAAREQSDLSVSVLPAALAARQDRTIRKRRFAAIAAATLFMVSLTAALVWNSSSAERHFRTRHGEQRTWQLPDTSVVHLNAGSGIKLAFTRDRREVILTGGQAYFVVAKDTHRPFRVVTSSALITALGTAFDVYEQNHGVLVSVVQGRVSVVPKEGSASKHRTVSLDSGERVRILRSGALQKYAQADIVQATAWMRQQIAFKREPVTAVAAEFNRYNRKPILIQDAAIGATRISGVFDSYDVQSFLDFLEQLPGVRIAEREGQVLVVPEDRAMSETTSTVR